MQYQLTNNIPASKIFSLKDLDMLPQDATKLVILDDIAGSGDSLKVVVKHVGDKIKNLPEKEIIAMPIISTKQAINLFKQNKINYMAGKEIEALKNLEWYKSLNYSDQVMLEKLMAGEGYGHTCANISMPYMAPDNNNTFFASVFAPIFTLNGQGVKNQMPLKIFLEHVA